MTTPTLLIVSGAPGAGKTTLARLVATTLELPYFGKDELKEAIADRVGAPADVPASQRLGLAAYEVLFTMTRRVLESGHGLVIESNFRRGLSERELRPLAAIADARLLHCTADAATIQARYADRFARGERHPAHLDSARAPVLAEELATGRYAPLDLDVPCLVVRTDDGYDPGLEGIEAFVRPGAPVAVGARA